MTIQQILSDFKRAKKPITRETFYQYRRRFRIKPLSRIRQRPQHYPADTTARMFLKLGLTKVKGRIVVTPKLTTSHR